jgi:hypothetical protein
LTNELHQNVQDLPVLFSFAWRYVAQLIAKYLYVPKELGACGVCSDQKANMSGNDKPDVTVHMLRLARVLAWTESDEATLSSQDWSSV